MARITKPPRPSLSLSQIDYFRKKIFIFRGCGGLGDILVSATILENFKNQYPDISLHFICPKYYHLILKDHPFIDELIDSADLDDTTFMQYYDITDACNEYEEKTAPFVDKFRGEIWSEHCGLKFVYPKTPFLIISDEEKEWAKNQLPKDKKSVLFMPVSVMKSKDLDEGQIYPTISALERMGFFVFSVHDRPLKMNCIYNVDLRQWLSLVDAVDYVVSVDTAVMHCRGILKKPMTAIFCWSDWKIVAKYYAKMIPVQKHRDDDPTWTCGPCWLYTKCPKDQISIRKPCNTEITADVILSGFNKMLETYG